MPACDPVTDPVHGCLVNGIIGSYDGDAIGNHGYYDFWFNLLIATHPIGTTADFWTITHPYGERSYIEGTNATYLAETRPGADLVNVSVDDELVGPVSNWTFTVIGRNHTFATTGQPISGQMHLLFGMNTIEGPISLKVAFTNQSLGNPTSFFWNFGDGGISSEEDPVHTYRVPGTYVVTPSRQ